MKEDVLDEVKAAGGLSNEERTQAIIRCINVVDYLYETASRIVIAFIETQPCENAGILSKHPEELAIKAMEVAMQRVACGGRQQGEQVH